MQQKPSYKKIERNVRESFGTYWKTFTPDEKRAVINNIENIMFYGNIPDTPENIQMIACAIRNGFFIGMRY